MINWNRLNFLAEFVRPKQPVMPVIVGSIRSGTTLLRLMLDSHPLLTIPPETSFPESIFHDAVDQSGAQIASKVINSKKWADLGIDAQKYLSQCEYMTGTDALRLVWNLYRVQQGKQLVGDKSPGYSRYLPAITAILPEGRIIHIIRDGRDCYASQLNSRYGLFSTRIRTPQEQANAWVQTVGEVRKAGEQLPYYLEVRYESLVTEPEKTLNDICRFLDLPFDSKMMNYSVNTETRLAELRPRVTAEGHRQSASQRQSAFHLAYGLPDPSRIGRWAQVLLPNEVTGFEKQAAPLLTALGYPLADKLIANSDPESARTYCEEAWQLIQDKRYSDAYLRAIDCYRADPQNRKNSALLMQLSEWTGDWPTQWSREIAIDQHLNRRFQGRLEIWTGQQLTSNQQLFVWRSCRDIGADIRYSAILSNLNDTAKYCRVEVDERLIPLLQRRFPDIDFQAPGVGPQPDCVFHASWEVLGHFLMPSAAAMPAEPWLIADKNIFNRPLSCKTKPLVGISWHSTNANKHLPPLQSWKSILGVSGIEFVSVQYGVKPESIAEWHGLSEKVETTNIDLYNDLDSLGSILSACDLVITVSNSVAHQAGAQGISTWVIMYEEAKLSWPLGQPASSWYRNSRLYWVQSEIDWKPFMDELASKLESWERDEYRLNKIGGPR